MKQELLAILFVLVFASCTEQDVQITNEYILNKNWTKGKNGEDANSIGIIKMKVKKDSLLNPFSELSQNKLLDNLEYDSSFMYTAVIKIKSDENYQNKKIYFNRYNDFYWWTEYGTKKIKFIGDLQKNAWYEFTGLTSRYNHFIYIDSSGKGYSFKIDVAENW